MTNTITVTDQNNQTIMDAFLSHATELYMPLTLIKAAINQFGGDYFVNTYDEISQNRISIGYKGYNYHSETLAFFKENTSDIIKWLDNHNDNVLGNDSIVKIFSWSPYLKGISIDEMNRALYAYNGELDDHQRVANQLTWIVGQRVCVDFKHFMDSSGLVLSKMADG